LAGADLTSANLAGINLAGGYLRGANLTGTNLTEADLHHANLYEANLASAILAGTDLTGANLCEANLASAYLNWAALYETYLGLVRGAHLARSLETVRLTPTEPTDAANHTTDSIHFEYCDRLWPEQWLDWERLRVVGRLPLFGVSYTVLILIPILFYSLALYNNKVERVRAWAEHIVVLPDSTLPRLAPFVLERLHPCPIPSLSFLLLVSTVLLAVGSTLYTFFCPCRVKEFSRDQWCDQLGHSLLHYWPLAWKYRYLRLACAACYALGGAGALWVLGTKVWQTALFILKHSAFP
jgi:Pentapeptide repeats (8 copies)